MMIIAEITAVKSTTKNNSKTTITKIITIAAIIIKMYMKSTIRLKFILIIFNI